MTSLELQPSSSRAAGQTEQAELANNQNPKTDIDLVESAGAGQAATYEESLAARLPKAHRDYLLERHGTLNLDPVPGMSPADPYNWPEWKVSFFSQIPFLIRQPKLIHGTENGQSHPRSMACLHGHFYRGCHHPRLL
jgi:hypothetical protein